MAAFCHLRFVLCVFGLPTNKYSVVFITMQNLVGIDAVLSIIQVSIFYEFGLKMPTNASKVGFGGFDHPKGWSIKPHCDP